MKTVALTNLLVLGAIALFVLPAAGADNLITNGSFEFGNFIPDLNNVMSLTPGATDITGWTVVNAEMAWIGTPSDSCTAS